MNYLRSMLMVLLAIPLFGCPELGTQERTIEEEIPENPTWSVDVKPILDVYCNECHTVPPEQLAPPNIRLDVCETVGGVSGAQSQAIRIVFRTIDQVPSPMPPADYGIYPTAAEQEILQRWVDQGASCEGATNINPNNVPSDMGNNTMIPIDMGGPGVDMGMDAGVDMGMDLGMPPATWVMVAAMLEQNCSSCHDAGRQNLTIPMGGTPAEIQAQIEGMSANTGDMNPFITPNDPAASEIYLRVSSPNMAFRMPPSSGQVNETLRAALESWINDGAPYN